MVLTIYCDLDGVLVDFDKKVRQTFNVSPEVLLSKENQKEGWAEINSIPNFWYDVDWTDDGKQLWAFLQNTGLPVKILTTPADSVETCREDKKRWVKEQIGDVEIIFSASKEDYASSSSILIDDRFDNIQKFVEEGGIGIQHTSTKETIEKLKKSLDKKKIAMKNNVIGQGDWLTLKITDDGYEYIEDKPGVAIVPLRVTRGQLEVLVRQEDNPIQGARITIVTGRRDDGEDFLDTAIRELREETGYDVDSSKFVEVGPVFYSKSHITSDIIYLVAISNEQQGKPETDGTMSEKLSSNMWVGINDLKNLIQTSSNGVFLAVCSKILVLLEN